MIKLSDSPTTKERTQGLCLMLHRLHKLSITETCVVIDIHVAFLTARKDVTKLVNENAENTPIHQADIPQVQKAFQQILKINHLLLDSFSNFMTRKMSLHGNGMHDACILL